MWLLKIGVLYIRKEIFLVHANNTLKYKIFKNWNEVEIFTFFYWYKKDS